MIFLGISGINCGCKLNSLWLKRPVLLRYFKLFFARCWALGYTDQYCGRYSSLCRIFADSWVLMRARFWPDFWSLNLCLRCEDFELYVVSSTPFRETDEGLIFFFQQWLRAWESCTFFTEPLLFSTEPNLFESIRMEMWKKDFLFFFVLEKLNGNFLFHIWLARSQYKWL